MIFAIASNTCRECLRRPFPYLSAATIVALHLVSRMLGFSAFAVGAWEAMNLAISTVLLAALATAAFVGTALVRADLERGTYLLTMSQPVGLAAYLVGRFTGLLVVTALVCGLTAGGGAAVMAITGAADSPLSAPLLLGWARVALAIPVLSSAALALSALTGRVFAPVLLVVLFAMGDVLGTSVLGRLLPAFGLFGFDAGRSPSMPWLSLYSALHSVVFLIVTYLRLTLKPPIRTES